MIVKINLFIINIGKKKNENSSECNRFKSRFLIRTSVEIRCKRMCLTMKMHFFFLLSILHTSHGYFETGSKLLCEFQAYIYINSLTLSYTQAKGINRSFSSASVDFIKFYLPFIDSIE